MPNNTQIIKDSCKQSVTDALAKTPDKWSTKNSANTVISALSVVQDKNGAKIILTPEEHDVISAIADPTGDVIKRVLGTIAANHDADLDDKGRSYLRMVIDPAQFRQKLASAGKIKLATREEQISVKDILD